MAIATYRSLREIDWPLMLITLAICALGVLQIYSATLGTPFRDAWFRQILYIGVGLSCSGYAAGSITTRSSAIPTGCTAVRSLALIAVFAIGTVAGGASRWIPMGGGFKLQVSEFVKIVLVLVLARVLTELKRDDLDWRDLLRSLVLSDSPLF